MTRMVQLIVAAGLLAACSAYKPFTPATVQAPADPFNKSVRVLVGRGESIETKDEGAGVIVTAWKEQSQMGTDRRLRWNITVVSGQVTVNSQCEMQIQDDFGGAKKWKDCGDQPKERTDLAKAIADEISR